MSRDVHDLMTDEQAHISRTSCFLPSKLFTTSGLSSPGITRGSVAAHSFIRSDVKCCCVSAYHTRNIWLP